VDAAPSNAVHYLVHAAATACTVHYLVAAPQVYEHSVFPPLAHKRIAQLPGMRERTVTLSSAGKLFSLTGWRVAWVVGPSRLVTPVSFAHTHLTYCAPTPLQVHTTRTLFSPLCPLLSICTTSGLGVLIAPVLLSLPCTSVVWLPCLACLPRLPCLPCFRCALLPRCSQMLAAPEGHS
jgi:hypothetical protein